MKKAENTSTDETHVLNRVRCRLAENVLRVLSFVNLEQLICLPRSWILLARPKFTHAIFSTIKDVYMQNRIGDITMQKLKYQLTK